ncbi:MAG: phage major capsid protein [Deltaproteobacteria bacterium]|nr:phage major capsid protein [Deltaproteobacteria bacterium]
MDPLEKVLEKIGETKALVDEKFVVLSGDLQAKIAELQGRCTFLEEQLKSRGVSLPGVNEEKTKFSFVNAIRAIRFGDWTGADFEKEVFAQVAKQLGTDTGPAGGYIVPVQYVAELIELLKAEAIVVALGATVLDGLVGSPVEFPKQTGGATAYWVGENEAITASAQTLGQLKMSPKSIAALVKMSNRLLKLSNPSVEAMVRRDIAQAVALGIDLASLRGSGTEHEPLGIANTSKIKTVALGTDGDWFTLDSIVDMEGQLEDANALRGKLGIAWHGKVKRHLKKTKIAQYSGDTGGQWVMLPMSDKMLSDIIGYMFKTTTQIPTNLTKNSGTNLSEVYFGNWQELLIGQWGGLEILASQETSDAFEKNQTWVRIIQEVDIGLRHPESFCLCSDAKTQ